MSDPDFLSTVYNSFFEPTGTGNDQAYKLRLEQLKEQVLNSDQKSAIFGSQ